MCVCPQFLQIGTIAFFLAGCASAPPSGSHPPDQTPPQRPSGGAPIRIGPAKPPAEPPAALTPGGQLRPEALAYARQLADERPLPLNRGTAAPAGARYN